MDKLKLLVLDDYEGELAHAPAMARLRQLAEVTLLDRPLDDYATLKDYHAILALRERTKLNRRFLRHVHPSNWRCKLADMPITWIKPRRRKRA